MNYFNELRCTGVSSGGLSGRVEYVHNKEKNSGTAYERNECVYLKIKIPRSLGATAVLVCLFTDDGNELLWDAIFEEVDGECDLYSLKIDECTLEVGIYFFYIVIEGFERIYGTKNKAEVKFFSALSDEYFQLSVCDFKYPPPTEKYGGVIYQIFVDRFMRSGSVVTRDDAIYVSDWNEDISEYPKFKGDFLKNNTFYGGNLHGVTDKLDYISSLGVNIIYLNPIFEAYSNHKYDVGDYNKVDEGFGGDEALERLIRECKKRGIFVVLDGVFNHTGADSIYFNKFGKYGSLGAYNSKESPYYEWYDFKQYPDEYDCWWGINILPRINPRVDSCSNFFVGTGGVIERYTSKGVDGFRLDVVDELSDNFVAQIRAAQARCSKNSFLYGEVWEDASNKIAYGKRKKYYLGEELDGVMNYPLRTGIINYILNKSIDSLEYAIFEVLLNMPKRIRDFSMNLLGSHDTERILTVLGGCSSVGKSNDELRDIRMGEFEYKKGIQRLKLAYTVLATLPGMPTVFYGDEAGMEGYSDPFNRRTFPWENVDKELLSHYIRIGEIRKENCEYKEGELSVLYLDGEYFLFSRWCGKKRIVTFANNSSKSVNLNFDRSVTELITKKRAKGFCIDAESALIFSVEGTNFVEF